MRPWLGQDDLAYAGAYDARSEGRPPPRRFHLDSLVRAALSRMFWRVNRRVWSRLSQGARDSRGGLVYGRWIHSQMQRRSREMYVWSTSSESARTRPDAPSSAGEAKRFHAEGRRARLQVGAEVY